MYSVIGVLEYGNLSSFRATQKKRELSSQSPEKIQKIDIHPKGLYSLHHRSIRVQNWGSILYTILYHILYTIY